MTKLGKSISVAEMLHMRNEEGLSNGEIAKRLGCTTNTVIRYIGKQPHGVRKPWGSNRKKDELPALSENTEVPEMPRKSFAERCEEALGEPMVLHTLKHDYAARKEAEELSKKLENFSPAGQPKMHINYLTPPKEGWGDDEEEEMAENAAPTREVQNPSILPQRIRIHDDVQPCTLEDMARLAYERRTLENRKANADGNSHIHELIAIFGSEAVITWLRVSLYDMGIPDCRPMNRQKMLETLKNMNAGGANT
jgi:hypothetical protein